MTDINSDNALSTCKINRKKPSGNTAVINK